MNDHTAEHPSAGAAVRKRAERMVLRVASPPGVSPPARVRGAILAVAAVLGW